jgi:hypothetical protein
MKRCTSKVYIILILKVMPFEQPRAPSVDTKEYKEQTIRHKGVTEKGRKIRPIEKALFKDSNIRQIN